jgi:alkylation response protein AidB-like acyl-CoA dehydrogenase
MRLGDNRRTARFRAELESWLDEHPPPGARAIDPSLSSGHLPDWAREWQRTLFDAGWLMPRWPAGLGGHGAGPVEHLTYLEEMSRRQVPRSLNPQGLDVCAPVLVEHGTDEQRERWTLPTLWGEITWCLAVSHEGVLPGEAIHPGFRLTKRDRELVVSGREPAPPGAQHADWCLCAAQVVGRIRGGPEDLAVLVVDLRSTGVVRPLRPAVTDAAHDPDELIFDEVVLGANAVVNAAGGSAVVEGARAHERTARWTARLLDAQRALDALVTASQAPGLAKDPVFRDRMAALRVDCDSARALAYRALAKEASGRPAPELAMLPLITQELCQKVYLAGTEALGSDGLDLALGGPFPWPSGAWPEQWLAALAETASVNALTEQERIAARVLGLPPGR